MPKQRVMAAMSGGVDSTVMAALLLEEGYEVMGLTMDTGNPRVIKEAQAAAQALGISHYAVPLTERFTQEVIGNFIAEYRQGRTPNPCIFCNKRIKFGALWDFGLKLGFDYFATGHYAQIRRQNSRTLLYKAGFARKDQSYVLYALSQEVLGRLLLPLGTYDKDVVRAKAQQLGLAAAAKPDSQDICFIPDGDYRSFLKSWGVSAKPGAFVDKNGNVLGRHQGLPFYTVGQRKGLGIALGHPVYVVSLKADTNEVVLGTEEDLLSRRLVAENCNFIPFDRLVAPLEVMAKIRYKAQAAPALISPMEDGAVEVVFEKPEKAVTPGQSVVFYQGDLVVGGGIIQ